MSLSTWLRDYLYFSLPGNRGRVMPYVNLIGTFALAGLWHGAAWTFVLWGLLHGAWGRAGRSRINDGGTKAAGFGAGWIGRIVHHIFISSCLPGSFSAPIAWRKPPTCSDASRSYRPARETFHCSALRRSPRRIGLRIFARPAGFRRCATSFWQLPAVAQGILLARFGDARRVW